jgi:hypothetical protein
MKVLLYFPLAYLANVHGFILLVPYLVIFLTVVRSAQVYRRAVPVPVPVPVTVKPPLNQPAM